jgi:two-component system NtrC family sensor kinase
MGTLLAGITHDIRNPLTFLGVHAAGLGKTVKLLQGWIEALEADESYRSSLELPQAARLLEEIEELPTVVSEMVRGLSTINTIVQGIQNQVRASSAPAQPADPARTLQYAARLVQGAVAGAGGRLEISVSPEVESVALSTVELSQVLLNLLTNSVQAFDGKVGEKVITVRASPERGGVEFVVTDTGPGMTPEVKSRAFEKFFTTKPQGVGTGLGLANCKRIVEGSGGSISLSSAPGLGTTFTFWVPAAGMSGPRPSRSSTGHGDGQVWPG